VQALPSLQLVPFAAAGFEQIPVPGSQVPATWHWSEAMHVSGLDPVQVPAWQVSSCVHRLPSLHGVLSAAVGFEHAPVAGLHMPAVWHWSEALQTTGLVPTHIPIWHVSVCVQAFPSSQLAVLGV